MTILFAYTKDAARRIVRFELDATIQAEMDAFLLGQADCIDTFGEIAFDGKYRPEDDELLCIPDFDDIDSLATAVANPLGVPVASHDEDLLLSIKALFFGRNNGADWSVYLQAFDRRRLISNKGFSIFHAGNVYTKLEGNGLIVDNRVAAKLTGTKLCFRSFFIAKQIFDLSTYYQEATNADISEFSQLPQVDVAQLSALEDLSDTWVRRKLWLVQQSKILETVSIGDLQVAAAAFQLQIPTVVDANGNERISIPTTKRELKTLLRFLDEDFYTSSLSKTNFMTNSKVALP